MEGRTERRAEMKMLRTGCLSVVAFGFFSTLAMAAGDVGKGKALFNDPKLGGATAGVSCNSCHPDGKGLEKAGDRKDLKAFVNSCIENALKGRAVDPKSKEMDDIVAYIQSLKGKKPAEIPKNK
jgi:mono/diheme cytochrome c family protein